MIRIRFEGFFSARAGMTRTPPTARRRYWMQKARASACGCCGAATHWIQVQVRGDFAVK